MHLANIVWKFQSLLWNFLPADREVSFSIRVFGVLLVVSSIAFGIGYLAKHRWLTRASALAFTLLLLTWGLLYATRPAWLRIAMQPVVPSPTTTEFPWETN